MNVASKESHHEPDLLRRWPNVGQLVGLRVGLKRERRFRRAELLAFVEDHPRETQPGRAGAPGAAGCH